MSISNEDIIAEIKRNSQELKSLIEAVEVRLSLKVEDINRKITKLEIENEKLTTSVEFLDRKLRERNIIIFGLKSNSEQITTEFVKNNIKKLVNVDIADSDLNNFYTLGKANNPPIKIELTTLLKKKEILKNAKNLSGSVISIANDLTIIQRHQNKILRKHLNLARGNKEQNCFIRGNKLHVNGKSYLPEELENQEDKENFIQKPRSAPGTPIQTIANVVHRTEEKQLPTKTAIQKSNTTGQKPHTPKLKPNIPTQKTPEKSLVPDKQKMKTRANSMK